MRRRRKPQAGEARGTLLLCRFQPERGLLGPVVVADRAWRRAKGLLGAGRHPVPMLFPRTSGVHSIGMGIRLDVAYLDRNGVVLETAVLAPFRVAWPRRGARMVLEAEEGTFLSWGLREGDHLGAIGPDSAT